MNLSKAKNVVKKIVVITGLTASGKSELASLLAEKYNGEIINADSAQVYKEIPVISAQPSKATQNKIKHHLYGNLELSEGYSVANWLRDCRESIDEISANNKLPIICGGTGLYINSLLYGLDEIPATDPKILASLQDLTLVQLRNKYKQTVSSLNNTPIGDADYLQLDKQRLLRALCIYLQTSRTIESYQQKRNIRYPNYDILTYVFIPDRSIIKERIKKRCFEIISQGGLEEASKILTSLVRREMSFDKVRIIGLKQLIDYHMETITLEEACEEMIVKTNQYAKRQSTWFRLQIKYNNNSLQYDELANHKHLIASINSHLESFML